MVGSGIASMLEELRGAASQLASHVDRDGGAALVETWRGVLTSEPEPHAVFARAMTALCKARATGEELARELPSGVADIALLWAESAAYRSDVVLSPLLGCAAAGAGYRSRAAVARLAHGPFYDALHALPSAWTWHRSAGARVRQLLWEAGARGLTLPALGRWIWTEPSAIEELVIERARGHLGDRVLAARALATFSAGFAEDAAPAQMQRLLTVTEALIADPEPLVWTAAARGLGRLTEGSSSARLQVFQSATAARLSARRRNVTAIASMPLSVGAEAWISEQLEAVLDPKARREDPWKLAALAVATPHLAREREELWGRLCAVALETPSAELTWSLAQGLAILARHGANRGWVSAEERVAQELRARVLGTLADNDGELARQLDAVVSFDRALGMEPATPHCLDAFDVHVRAEVDGTARQAPAQPRTFFDRAVGDLESVDRRTRAGAILGLRSATRAHAMHLDELVLGATQQDADGEHMLAVCRDLLAADVCSYGKRHALVGAVTDLVGASAVGVSSRHGRTAARALRIMAGSRWVHELERDTRTPETAKAAEREVKRFRKPLEDLFQACLARRTSTDDDTVTVPPVVAAWWSLCAGPGIVLASIERARDGQTSELGRAIAELEQPLAAAATTTADEWGRRAIGALERLGARDTMLAAVFSRLVEIIVEIERPSSVSSEADVVRLLGSLSSAAHALVTMAEDLDDALAPRGTAIDSAPVGQPRWIAVADGGVQTRPGTLRAQAPLTQLVPALRALIDRHVQALEDRRRQFSTFEPRPGARFGEFELLELLGRGGMGEVWRAKLQGVRLVALKLPRADVGNQHRERLRHVILAEATTMYRLQFSRVATLLSAGIIGTTPYLATVLIRGRGLDDHLIYDDDADPSGRHLPIVRRVFSDVCIGLDNLHRHGLVHRDLKPSNVMLRMRGTDADPIKTIGDDPKGREIDDALLIDFGIAHEFNARGAHGGTPGYAAPEVASDGIVGPAADIYALGATLYHVLTGQPVTGERTDVDAFKWHEKVEPADDPDVRVLARDLPEPIRDAILGSTRRDPLRRISLDEFRSLVCDV